MLGLGDSLLAVAVALAHVEVQAGALLVLVSGKFLPAGGQLQGRAQGVQDGLGVVAAPKGAEIPGPVIGHAALDGEAGVALTHRQADVGVALVVLQQDVVAGFMALDEGVFQHQGLKLRVGHDGIEVVDLGHHGPGLFRVAGLVVEVLADPVFQGLGLAHIDDRPLFVHHQVDPGLKREAQRFFFQFVKGHLPPPLPS